MKTLSQYAPVVIPTLCRAECFIPCLESLSRCAGAEHTDVYIALDYPLKDSHWEGYNKIVTYLESQSFPFKSTNIVKREKNYGVGGANSNVNVIFKELWKKYDRIIFTEDDNVFSPNFLLYINKGLDLFEDDRHVDSICGYLNYNGVIKEKNTFYRCPNYYSAWGVATWKNRIEDRRKITTEYFRKSLSIKNLVKMAKLGRGRFLSYLSAICPTNYLWQNDVNLSTYLILEGKTQIRPTISLVKNIGVVSGENFSGCSNEIADLYLNQPVSTDNSFEFIGTGYEYQQENIKFRVQQEKLFHKKYHWLTWQVVLKKTIKYFIKIILSDFGHKSKK